jgi:arylsulfatase A-like enzyme
MVPLLAAAAAAATLVHAASGATTSPPHLVFVLGDDVGHGDVGYVDPAVISPRIDELARSGVRFGRHYSYMWCAPSRSALMTGRLPPHNGVYSGASGAYFALSLDYRTLPQMLAPAGYISHAVGKWHLGMHSTDVLPESRGFASYFGYLNGGEDYYWHDSGGGGGNRSISPDPEGDCSHYRDLWDSSTASGAAADSAYFPRYSTFLFAEKATRIIEDHVANPATATAPLFLYLPFQAAHSPMQVPEEFQRLYPAHEPCQRYRSPSGTFGENKNYACEAAASGRPAHTQLCACNRMVIAAQVTALDSAIGNITNSLRSTGLWDNCVFVFSGDNGGPESEAHWNAGLRGGKWTNFEGGLRPAAFLASPLLPKTQAGRWCNSTIHLVDWSATFMRLAGLDPSNEPTLLDGVDQWPAISGKVPAGTELRKHTLVSIFAAPPHKIVAGVGILLSGRFKLATMPLAIYGEGGSNVEGADCMEFRPHCWSADCLLGTGGGWLPEPMSPRGSNVGGNQNMCPDVDCANLNVTAPEVDAWLCSPQSCSIKQPCLFDVVSDPGERHNLAANRSFAHVVASMMADLVAMNASVVPPYSAVKDTGGEMCKAFKARGLAAGAAGTAAGGGVWPWFGPWYNMSSNPMGQTDRSDISSMPAD